MTRLSTKPSLPPCHVFGTSMSLPGHARPLLALAINLLTANTHLRLTFLVHRHLLPLVEGDIARHNLTKDDRARFCLVLTGNEREEGKGNVAFEDEMFDLEAQMAKVFNNLYEKALLGEPLFDGHRPFEVPPSVILADVAAVFVPVVKASIESKLSLRRRIGLVLFSPFTLSWQIRLCDNACPDEPDRSLSSSSPLPGSTEIKRRMKELWKEQPELTDTEVWVKAHEDSEPVLVSIPSVPDFYTHEEVPQPSHQLPPGFWASLAGPVGAVIMPCRADYLAVGFSVILEREAVDEVEARMGKVGAYLPVGPQFPESFWCGIEANSTPEHASGSTSEQVLAFMDRALQQFGKESVLFISFGSICYPSPEYLALLLEVLFSLGGPPLPFVFARDPVTCPLPDELIARVAARPELALLVNWAPQQAILQHPATSFFLSHCGSGGSNEAIACGVPLICWPIAFDQPIIALSLSQRHRVAFELVQVRTGPANVSRPLARGGIVHGTPAAIESELRSVLTASRGKEGAEMRARMRRLGEEVRRERKADEGGVHARAMERLGEIVGEFGEEGEERVIED